MVNNTKIFITAKKTIFNKYTIISKGNNYELIVGFNTTEMFSGKCYVIFDDDGHFRGLDSNYFEDVEQNKNTTKIFTTIELWSKENINIRNNRLLIKDKKYLIFAKSKTEKSISDLIYVVKCEDKSFRGFNSTQFETYIERKTREYDI